MVKTCALRSIGQGFESYHTYSYIKIYFKVRYHNSNIYTYKYNGNSKNNDYNIYSIIVNSSYRCHMCVM